jgi:hypothetical protein
MPELTRRQVALILGAASAAFTLAVGAYGLITGPNGGPDSVHDRTLGRDTGRVSNPNLVPDSALSPRALPQTSDAVAYARAVASRLFDWDTAAGYLPADYQSPLLADADPTGEEVPGLITDVNTYFPTIDQWLDLATMKVTQTLTIDSAEVPASWQSVLEQAHGELRPGTTAVTITGTRHRTGIWHGTHAATSSTVALTVFAACQLAFERCHVLRLSALDNPLK